MEHTIGRAYGRFRWLMFGYITATTISALATFFLARIMKPVMYGIYAKGLAIPFLFFGLADLGMGSAVTYYISTIKGKNDDLASSYLKTGLVFAMLLSSSLAVMIVVFAPQIAGIIFKKEGLLMYFRVSGLIVIYLALTSVCNGALLCIYKQKAVGIYYLSTSIFRNMLAVLLYVATRDAFYAILGQAIGFVTASIVYAVYTIYTIRGGRFNMEILKNIITYGMPYGIGLFIMTLCIQFYNVVAARSLNSFMYGNFSAAWLILSGVMAIPSSFSQSLFPSFSETGVGVHINPSSAFNSAVKFAASMFLYLWITFGGMADIIVGLVYGSEYVYAGEIFVMLSSVFILSIFGWGIINPLLLSMRKTKILAAINIASVVISLFAIRATSILQIKENVWAIPFAFFVLHASVTFMGLGYLWKKHKIRLSATMILKLLLIVGILFVLSRKLSILNINISMSMFGLPLDFGPILKVSIGFIGVGIIYIIMLIVFRVLTREDYEILKNSLFSFPIFRRILGLIAEPAFNMSERLNGIIYKLNKNSRRNI